MKRLFLTLLCLLIFCGIADARMLQGVAGSGYQSAASCTTSNDTEIISQGGAANNTSITANCVASKITVSENTYITEIVPNVSFYGGDADLTCSIFTVVDNKPGSEVAGTSVTDTITGSGHKTMTLDSAVLLTGTAYYVVCRSLGATAAIWYRNTTEGESTSATNTSGTCGGTWATVGTSLYDLNINGCAP